MAKQPKKPAQELTMSMFASKADLEKAKKGEAAEALPPKCCSNCAYASMTQIDRFVCGVKLPPWVRRSDRPSDHVVSGGDVCSLHKRYK